MLMVMAGLLIMFIDLKTFCCGNLNIFFRSQRKEKKKQDGFKTAVKYSAQKLAEKGVVLEIEGLPKNQYVVYLTAAVNATYIRGLPRLNFKMSIVRHHIVFSFLCSTIN